LIPHFRCVLNVVFFLLSDSWASELYTPIGRRGLRLFSSQTFSRMNTPTISSRLFFLLTPPMKM